MKVFLFFLLIFEVKGNLFKESLKVSNQITLSSYVKENGQLEGPQNTWVEVFSYRTGGNIYKSKKYCAYYKFPYRHKLGEFSVHRSLKNNCQWSQGLEPLYYEKDIEYLIIKKEKAYFSMKYMQKNRNKEVIVNLLSKRKHILMIPIKGEFLKEKSSYQKTNCGKRREVPCIRSLREISLSPKNCENLEKKYYCAVGLEFECNSRGETHCR